MHDIQTIIHAKGKKAAASATAKETEKKTAQECFVTRYLMYGADNRNTAMRTKRRNGRLAEHDADSIRHAGLLVYDF